MLLTALLELPAQPACLLWGLVLFHQGLCAATPGSALSTSGPAVAQAQLLPARCGARAAALTKGFCAVLLGVMVWLHMPPCQEPSLQSMHVRSSLKWTTSHSLSNRKCS